MLSRTLYGDSGSRLILPSGDDDTGTLLAAYNAAKAAGGGVVRLGPGEFILGAGADGFTWDSGSVCLLGSGDATVLKAAPTATSSVLSVTVGGGGRGLFSDFTVDGAGVAANPMKQTIPSETSVGTRFVRVRAQNAAAGDFQWYNSGCEDCTYQDCFIPGDESAPGAIAPAMNFEIPAGLARIVGGEIFGTVRSHVQQLTVEGATIGPFLISNPSSVTNFQLELSGCYIYDGPEYQNNGGQCIGTENSLVPITAHGCVFIAQLNPVFVNGNIPAGVPITLMGNTYVYAPGTAASVYAVQGSGSGYVTLLNSNPVMGSATWNHFNGVSGATTTVTNLAGP